jgi:outer membrane protein assembly factor BamD
MQRMQMPIIRVKGQMVRKRLRGPVVAIALGLLVSACASSTDNAKLLNPDPPDKMYASADIALQKGAFNEAARRFEDLDRDHPYAPEAKRAIVMAAYSYYKGGKFPEAIATAQRYTTLHPGTKEAALAHHIIASAHFDEIKTPGRDQTATRKALTELKTLRSRYPTSPYAQQAQNRILIAEDVLAANEMEVGRFYLKQNQLTGAIGRFKTVVTEYQTTAHVEEALYRLIEANMALGVVAEAQAAGAVLGHNFPDSPWYAKGYGMLKNNGASPQSGGWLANAFKGLVPGQTKATPPPAVEKVPEGLPLPEQLPAPKVPSGANVPTASTSKPPKPNMGLGLVTSN